MDIQEIKEICSLPKSTRPVEQIDYLLNTLKNIKIFKIVEQFLPASSFIELFQVVQYEFSPSASYIFRYGDTGTRFYIILEGRVSMQIPNNKSFSEITVFEKHSSFGDNAMDSQRTRGASAFCLTACHFLYFDKKDYMRYIHRSLTENKKSMLTFLRDLPLFNQMSLMEVKNFLYSVKEVVFRKGQHVFNEGEEPGFVYILKEGECQLSKVIEKDKSPVRGLGNIVRHNKYVAKTLAQGAIVGEDSVLAKKKYGFTCTVHSDTALLYQVSSKDFISRITFVGLLESFQKQIQEKSVQIKEWTKTRLNLDNIFKTPERQIKAPEKSFIISKTRILPSQSQAKIKSYSAPRVKKYLNLLNKVKVLPDLVKSKSQKTNGISVLSLNSFPILTNLWEA